MAIQFPCPGCSQPIEVDDIYAEKAATCPYCRKVVTVPAESMLGQTPPIPARPTTGGDAFNAGEPTRTGDDYATYDYRAGGGLHVGPELSYRDKVARTYGNYALICTVIGVFLMIATFIYGLTVMSQEMKSVAATQPEDSPIVMEQMAEKLAMNHPMLAAGPFGALFFAVAGLALGVTSVRYSKRSNWRGATSLIVCGLFILFFCALNGLAVMGGMGLAV